MLGPILMSAAQQAAKVTLGRLFVRTAVETFATTLVTTTVTYAGKKMYENSRQGKYQCDKCGREFRGTLGTDMPCPGCGKRYHLN